MSNEIKPMRLAIAQSCANGHRYYRESLTDQDCPYCLRREVNELKGRMRKLRMLLSTAMTEIPDAS